MSIFKNIRGSFMWHLAILRMDWFLHPDGPPSVGVRECGVMVQPRSLWCCTVGSLDGHGGWLARLNCLSGQTCCPTTKCINKCLRAWIFWKIWLLFLWNFIIVSVTCTQAKCLRCYKTFNDLWPLLCGTLHVLKTASKHKKKILEKITKTRYLPCVCFNFFEAQFCNR